MPFDSNLPPDGANVKAVVLRGQFNGLKDIIDAGPATDVVGGVPKLVPRDLFRFKTASSGPNLVDGNPGTSQRVVNGAVVGFEWSVDLGSPAEITTIQFAGAPGVDAQPGDVSADCRWSDDGAAWTVVGSLLVHPDDGTLQTLTFPSAGSHRYWGFVVTTYAGPGHGSDASFSAVQGFDGVTAVLAPEATAEVQAAAAADATAKADAAQAAAHAASGIYATSIIPRTWRGPWENGPLYTNGDVVSSNGALFVCLGDSQGQLPDSYVAPTGPWQLLAGVQGYVDAAAASTLAASSNNTNAVATLDTPYADPDSEALRQKMNEMLLSMRR